MNAKVEDYIFAKPPEFAAVLAQLRAMLREILPDHIEVMSYAMPGLRAPHKGGKMIIGYAAFAKHLGIYPHSGSVIPTLDCGPFKTSKSGVLFTPDQPIPQPLLEAILRTRQAEIAAGYGRKA